MAFRPGDLAYFEASSGAGEVFVKGVVVEVSRGLAVLAAGAAAFRPAEGADENGFITEQVLSAATAAAAAGNALAQGLYALQQVPFCYLQASTQSLRTACPRDWRRTLRSLSDVLQSDTLVRHWVRNKEDLQVDTTDAEETEAEPQPAASSSRPVPNGTARPSSTAEGLMPRRGVPRRVDQETDEEEELLEDVEFGAEGLRFRDLFEAARLGYAAERPAAPRGPPPRQPRAGGPTAAPPGLGGGLGGGTQAVHGPGSGGQEQMNMMMLAIMERLVDKINSEDSGGDMDGLRVNRALGKLRGLRQKLQTDPESIVTDFENTWEARLHASGKPWDWVDVADKVNWGKMLSLKRCFIMMGACLKLNRARKHSESRECGTVSPVHEVPTVSIHI